MSGGLSDDPTVNGTSDIFFHATDPGGGVYEAIAAVDGQVVEHKIIDEQSGRCRSLGGTADGLNAFLYTRPCPAEANADVSLNTATFTNGAHHLLVTATDAAGNAATVLDREITVANPLSASPPYIPACATAPDPGGRGPRVVLAARWHRHAGPRLRSRYGTSRTIEGTLTGPRGADGASGPPLANAPIAVCERPAYASAASGELATARTDTAGHWSIALPRELPSGALRLVYQPQGSESPPAAEAALALVIPASLRLHVAPRRVRAGGAIRLTGALSGGPLPPGGKQLVLEARSPHGRWIEFHVIRTGAAGRFSYPYRFRLAGPARYQFRVLSEAEADFPFAAGASNVVRVFEG